MDPQQLDHCVKAGDVEGARQLVRLGTPIDGLVDRRSPLMRAAMGNRLPMAVALLDMGAFVDFTNEEGQTALHFAANHGSVQVVDVLLDAGAELEGRSSSGRTPLAMACRNRQLAAAQKLVERGADPSTRDDRGWTLLFQAARAGSLEVVQWLVEELNADPSLEVSGTTAGRLADANSHKEVARFLHDAVSNLPNTKQSSLRGQRTATAKRDSKKMPGSASLNESHNGVPLQRQHPNTASTSTSLPARSATGAASLLKVKQARSIVQPSDGVYDTTTCPPGIVLILSYRTFSDEDLQERIGAECDVINLISVFGQMGYETEVHHDLTWENTLWTVQEFSTSERLRKVGCAIVVVSSHGGKENGCFSTADGKDVSVKHIHESFIKDQSKEVIQMAKIFFFQFCRGEIRPAWRMDSANQPPENIMSFFSTSDGFVAYRDPNQGSIFLSVWCEVLAEKAYKDDLDDLFREVQQRYKRKVGTTPEKQDLGFRKKFYFNPREGSGKALPPYSK